MKKAKKKLQKKDFYAEHKLHLESVVPVPRVREGKAAEDLRRKEVIEAALQVETEVVVKVVALGWLLSRCVLVLFIFHFIT